MPLLNHRFDAAFLTASRLHREQRRKGTDIPYLSHLLSVAALVLEMGGQEDDAIAAMLHDAAEDQGGEEVLALIKKDFGEHVAALVDALSDTLEIPKPPWKVRKQTYLDQLYHEPESVLRISLADKLHNARSTLLDLKQHGEAVWRRFKTGREEQIWYLESLYHIYHQCFPGPYTNEFGSVIERIKAHGG